MIIVICFERVMLMQKRQNFSRKRKAILDAISGTTIHPTAEWVYQALKPEYPDLSLGTVYRNITRFKEDGLIISVGIINGQERFDATVEPHDHFVCEECGAVLDLKDSVLPDSADQQVERRYGVQVASHSLVFRGICPKCMKSREKN